MRTFFSILICSLFLLFSTRTTQAQAIEIMGGNALNGAINGTILGGAIMGLTNNTSFTPIRVGLGTGILYGVGVGAYDVSTNDGNPIVVSGVFNDGYNSSIIVLIDTFYGAAAGAVVGTSVMLIAGQPLIDGLQYGSSAGAIVGFGFGLVDSFMLSERESASPSAGYSSNRDAASGIVSLQLNDNASLGFVSPSLIDVYESETGFSLNSKLSVNMLNIKFRF
jgi:hypothetical protein